jgi:hypothetical protein
MSTRIELGFRAETADGAMADARTWARAEPRLRLRTIASCRRKEPDPFRAMAGRPLWIVTVVVNEIEPVPA